MGLYDGSPQEWTRGFSAGMLYKANSFSDLKDGKLQLHDFPKVQLDIEAIPWDGTGSGSIDNPSWRLWLHSLKWVDQLLGSSKTNLERLNEVQLAISVVKQWVEWDSSAARRPAEAWDGHAVGMRITTLVSLTSELDDAVWLFDAIRAHMDHLIEPGNFDGNWNHGLVQSLGLLAAALRVSDASATELAQTRIVQVLDEMVDHEGAINEQAPAYSNYIHNLLSAVIRIWKMNGIADTGVFCRKLRRLERFIVHSLEPSSNFVQIGDSTKVHPDNFPNDELTFALSQGSAGVRPSGRNMIFHHGGYVFGRSGWGEHRAVSQESFYSIRFGPARIIHGHNDHTSLTWYDHGRNLIVDSGHSGYMPGPMRDHLRSPFAHNMTLLPDHRLRWDAETVLTGHHEGNGASFYDMGDVPYDGVHRKRGVLAIDKGPMVVIDRTIGKKENLHRQLWHLSPEFSLSGLETNSARFKSSLGDLDLVFVRFNLDANTYRGVTGVSFWEGSHEPLQGWVARRDREETAAPVIGFDVITQNLTLLTAVLAVPAGEKSGWSFREEGSGKYALRLHVGSSSYTVDLDRPSGRLQLRTPHTAHEEDIA